MRQPDIEIYLREDHLPALFDWLASLGPLTQPESGHGRGLWQLNGESIELLVVRKAAGKWASIWFDSPHTPWATDRDCALAVFAAIGQQVRCSVGGWQEDDGEEDADRWLKIDAEGEQEFVWALRN
ncbi:MAG: hypothetical protein B7Z23_12670 [Pseudomonadales bacterium 32-61-5]|uniref:Uncharacterized protein n=1 Tax=Halopseudomonas yangmingensis TaxID=1720063 RepID=A0A1I4N7U5_9GAMM|nr:hypothetical protein [Halopseudomonas yangmingensis]OYW88575.1 MAG: hypothetical protein B7Z23_12670 [Pseudomonadales bacterium 32-61-5]SFM11377.1 hypothetical protein SAMN05216217_101101 [Halopseudomonas yangmingensis]